MVSTNQYPMDSFPVKKGGNSSAVVSELRASRKIDDEEILAHFGKRQQFKRNFGLVSILGLACTLMLTWQGAVANLLPPLVNGGPTGAIIAFPLVAFGVMTQVLVMAEMASMMPLSGGEYNWVAILAPEKMSNFLSYTVGWVTVIAWQAACASVTFINTMLIIAIASVTHPTYQMTMWQAMLVFWALVALSVFVNTYLGRAFPSIEALVLILHIVGFFVILIVLIYLAPKNPTEMVFNNFFNGGGFSSTAQSVIIGSVTIMYSFNGVDGATHMAEEIENSAVVIPRAMIMSVLINGLTGYGMLIAICYCMGPLEELLQTAFPFPFVLILMKITNSTSATTVITCIIIVTGISGGIGLMASASRMLWAFAREDGVPLSRYVSRIERKTALPLYAIGITAGISVLLSLIPLGSTTAFSALTGLTVGSFYSAFMVSACVMLWRRLTTPADKIAWGPFRLGKMGVPITIVSLIYSFIGWFFSFWPPTVMVTVKTFNWSTVVYFGVMFISMGYYVFRAHRTYTGPKMEIVEVVRHGDA